MKLTKRMTAAARDIAWALGWARALVVRPEGGDEAIVRLTRERDELVAVIERGALVLEELEGERDAAVARAEKATEEMHGEHQCRVRAENEASFLRHEVERLKSAAVGGA